MHIERFYMSVAHEFGVYLIGMSDNDKKMLQRVLRVSTGSLRQYILTNNIEPSTHKLYLVNSDNNEAVSYWCKHFLNADNTPDVPTVFAGRRKINGEKIYNLSLPFKASQVLNTFDTMTVKEMNFIPELKIGGVLDETNLSHSFLENIVHSEVKNQQLFTALVVDDSQPVRKQLEIELKLLGARVELSENGEQAIELCRTNEYDIIFLDVVMPGIDGYKVCKFLKKNQGTKNTPVILLTGKSSPFDKVKGTLSGCDSYLTKPLEREKFKEIAQKFLTEVNQQENNVKKSHIN